MRWPGQHPGAIALVVQPADPCTADLALLLAADKAAAVLLFGLGKTDDFRAFAGREQARDFVGEHVGSFQKTLAAKTAFFAVAQALFEALRVFCLGGCART